MARPLIDFLRVAPLPFESFRLPRWRAVTARLLSHDENPDEATWLADLPPGWQGAPATCSPDEEFMVLAGQIRTGEDRLRRLRSRFVPAGAPRDSSERESGATVLLSPGRTDLPASGPPVRLNVSDLDRDPVWPDGLPAGAARTTLRHDPARHRSTSMLDGLPRWTSRTREQHDLEEEHFVTEGSFEPPRGMMPPGSDRYHPPGVGHAATPSAEGCLTDVCGQMNLRLAPVAGSRFPSQPTNED